jgi:very-short-patch-repair endonuclease
VIDGFIVDFYCHTARLAIEVDGNIHETQREYDTERDRAVGARGIQTLRVTNEQVQEALPSVLALIRAAIGSHLE